MGNNINVSNRNFKIPGVVNYSLGAERQLNAHTSVDLSFVGSTGFDQDTTDDINHISTGFAAHCNLEMGASVTTYNNCNDTQDLNPETVANPFQGKAAFSTANTGNFNGYYTNPYLSADAFTRPMPQFGEIYQGEQNDGKTQFNSLQAVVNHRWSHQLTGHGSFEWAKTMDSGAVYEHDLHTHPARTMWISGTANGAGQPNAIWELPVGKGRDLSWQKFQSAGRWLDRRLGNGRHLLLSGGHPFQRRYA